ncbi:YadA-like family protein [Sneathia sanguinegens]|uniref:YadA-like family protein n=1 Tax=Sneathia sanguinegens TaxID=40543 RepID=UPI0008345FDC|nr:YadA-like family protein [Sneathia sanguinegens]
MKNVINVEEMKRYLKRSLKKKVKITTSLIVLFMMSNSIVNGNVIMIDKGKISASTKPSAQAIPSQKNKTVALNPNSESGNTVGINDVAEGSVAVGYLAKASGGSSVAVGYSAEAAAEEAIAIGHEATTAFRESVSIGLQSKIKGDQGVSIGSKTAASGQAVAIGSDIYALGKSSIAIGNDDIGGTDHLPEETIRRIYKGIVNEGVKKQNEFDSAYIDSKQYSPTYAGGTSAIAIGSRSVAAADQSIAMGVLSFALANGSTAIGRYAFVDEGAAQGLAVGEKARVFSAHSLALGNENESTNEGSMSYGYRAKAVGIGSLAIGNKVASNAEIKNISDLQKIFTGNSSIDDKKNSIEKYNPEYIETGDTKFTLNNKDIKKLKSMGNYGISLGSNAYSIGNNSMTIGSLSLSEGKNSLALGVISYAKGDNSMAIGTESISKANNSMAIGIGAKAYLENSLALGNKSMTDYQQDWFNKKGYVPKGAISLPSSTNVGVISVGSIGQERRITNVAAGYRDTDAVNVSQLKSVEDKLSAVNLSGYDSSMVNFVSVDKTTADGEGKKMQDLAIRMGNYKEYIQLKAKLLEMKVRKEKNHETINGEVEKEIENLLKDAKYNYIKNKDESFKNFEAEINKSSEAATKILTEIDKKKDELIKDENLKSILSTEEKKSFEKSNFYNKLTTGKDAIAIGAFADATKEQAVAIGKNAKGDSFSVAIGGDSESKNKAVAIGDRAKALGVRSVAIGHEAKANNEYSVAIGDGSEANSSTTEAYLTKDQNSGGKTFAVGGTNVKRRITGVADGSADSDAVTVKQLKKVGNIIFTGDTGSNVTFELVKNIDIKGATAKKQNSTDMETWGQGDNKHTVENIQTHVSKIGDTQRIVIGMKDVPRFTKIKLGNDSSVNLSVNNNNLTLNNKKLTGLADGDISTSSTDAVTGKQLEARTKFTIQADEYRENDKGTENKSVELAFPKKIIFKGAEGKNKGKTYDTTYATDNVRTYIEKNGNDYEVIVAFKNKPKFDKVQIGEVGNFVISKNSEAFEFNKKKLGKVAPGRIGKDSGDVVVGDQLKDYVKQIDSSNGDDISVTLTDIMDAKNKVGVKYTLGLNQNLKNKINKIDEKADKSELTKLGNKEITFIGDTRGAEKNDIKVKLGEEIEIKAEDHWNYNKETKAHTDSDPYYETENLSTYYRIKDGKKQILIGMKSKPIFEEITIGKSAENRVSITKDGISLNKKIQDPTNNKNKIDTVVKFEVDNEGSLKLNSKKITGLAKGTEDSDAVNMQQFKTLESTVTNNTSSININKAEIAKKLNVDADNISEKGKNKLTEQLGTGVIADSNTNLVTGGVVKKYVTDEINEINTRLNSKLSSADVKVTGDDYITVNTDVTKPNHYTLVFDKDKIGKEINLSNNSKLNEKFDKYALLDGTNLNNNEFNLDTWQSKLGNGVVADNNKGLVTGGVVYKFVNNIKQELSNKSTEDLAKKLNVNADNLSDQGVTTLTTKLGIGKIEDNNNNLVKGGVVKTYVDDKLKDKLNSDDVKVTGDEYIEVTSEKDKPNHYELKFNEDTLKQLVNNTDITNNTSLKTELDKKADLDASNVNGDNLTKWQTVLGDGTIDDGNTGLVTGGVVKTYVDSQIKDKLDIINTNLSSKLSDITITGDKYIKATKVSNSNYTLALNEDILNNHLNSYDFSNNKVIKNINNDIDKKLNKDDIDVTGDNKYINVSSTGKKYTVSFDETQLKTTVSGSDFSNNKSIQDMLDKKANLDAGNVTGDNLTKWQSTLGTGKVEDNNKGLVTGGTVSAAIKPINTRVDQLSTDLNDKLSDITITGDDYITATKGSAKGVYTLSFNKDNLQNLINSNNFDLSKNTTITNINTELAKKANKDATNLEDKDVKDWQAKLGNGAMNDGDTGLVKGGVVKTYVDSKIENNTSTINTKLDKKLNTEDVDVKGDGKYITVTNIDNVKTKYKVAFDENKLQQLVNSTDITNNTYLKAKLDDKADKNANNLNDTDITSWQAKLGNGSVAKGETKLVKGDTVFNYVDNIVNNIKQDLSNKSNTDLTKKLNVDADNLSETGKTALTNALGTGTITDNNTNLVTGGTVKKYITDEINDINNKVSNKLSSDDVDVTGDDYITVNKGTIKRNHYSLVFDKDKLASDLDLTKNTKLTERFNKYALLDGTNLENIDLNVWQAKLGNGTITKDNTGLVKGGDIYNYVNTIKQELTNKSTLDLSNKLDKDGTNLDTASLVKLTEKLSNESNLSTPTNRLVTDTKVSEALKGKLDIDANNLTKEGENTLTNRLGTGEVKEGDTKLVTGGKVYEVKKELNKSISSNTQNITELDNKYTTLNNQVTTNTNDIKNLQTTVNGLKNTTQDITNIKNKLGDIDNSITNINTKLDGKLDKADLSITGDKYIGVKKDNKFNYTLSFNKTNLENDLDLTNNNSINNMFTTKLGDINTNIGDLKTKVESNTNNINSLTTKVDTNTNDITTLKQDMTKKLNVDADNLTAKGETNLINKLSKDSDISKPNNKLVTDKQVNEHLKNYYNKTEVDEKVSNISNTVVGANKKSDLALGGVANAVAMANLLQANSNAKYKTNISAAYGYYGGANALAVGFSGVSENRMVSYRVSGSVNTKGNIALGAGLGVMLGEFKTDKYPEKGKKISELEEKLKMQENEINILKKKAEKTDILEKQIQELMKLIKK